MLNHIAYKVGDGSSIKFWKDVWNGDSSLEKDFSAIFNLSRLRDGNVSDHLDRFSCLHMWNLHLCRNLNDWEEVEAIALL